MSGDEIVRLGFVPAAPRRPISAVSLHAARAKPPQGLLGSLTPERAERVNLEFVSANPAGSLTLAS
jgi:hypothetical protein